MHKHLRNAAITLGGTLLSSIAIAAPEQQAAAFMDIYSSHCLKYLHDFDGLRKHLSTTPQLPAMSKPPAPFASERKRNTADKGPDGVKSTVAYEWSNGQSPRKPLFALTVTTSKSSVAQGVATAAIGH